MSDLFQERETLFVDVIVPLAIPNLYTYRIPFELNPYVKIGQRVVVPFGKKKLYTSIVANVHSQPPSYTTKYIDFILDESPIVTPNQLKLWHWIASYYMAHIGEVMNAALPARFKLASETKILPNKELILEGVKLNEQEILLLDALDIRGQLDLNEAGKIIDRKTVYPVIKKMIDRDLIVLEEEIKELFVPKVEKLIELNPSLDSEAQLETVFQGLRRSKAQEKLLLTFIKMSNHFDNKNKVVKGELINAAEVSPGVLKSVLDKEILVEKHVEVGRFDASKLDTINAFDLSDAQQKAKDGIDEAFTDKDVALLHGVTGSGKTEIFVKLIEDYIAQGKKVLYLLPEIALTTQIINRLKRFFGNRIGVYHSKFAPNERVEVWNNVLNSKFNDYDIILGARSAIFLPFRDLGLIIVDEEHESSYKQMDPSPRYNARDSAIVLAKQFGAKVLLGSATPSVETMKSAIDEKIGYVEVTERYGGIQLPEIQCADLLESRKKRKMHGIFSELLLDNMKEALLKGEQIILFQNRRGYAPRWVCQDCNTSPECTRCDVSLNYHKYQHILSCHYCGFTMKPPRRCSACGSTDLKMVGLGTEKIEEEVSIHLGEKYTVQRMDLDTTRSKHGYQNIINQFEERKIDILVGTQMISKGLDFDNVSLVGVLNADDLLYYPDFRVFERAYQLMSQVAGRAGRKKKRGKVIVQASDPHHWIIQKVMQNDYHGMYKQEIYERKNFMYPPFYKMIKITLRHKLEDVTDKASLKLANDLRNKLGNRVLGPEYQSVKRIRNQFHKHIHIKFERNASASKVKQYLDNCVADNVRTEIFKGVRLRIDVDPI